MFDIGWSELLVIAVVAIVVVGPKDLPQADAHLRPLRRQAPPRGRRLPAPVRGRDARDRDGGGEEGDRERARRRPSSRRRQADHAAEARYAGRRAQRRPRRLPPRPPPTPAAVSSATEAEARRQAEAAAPSAPPRPSRRAEPPSRARSAEPPHDPRGHRGEQGAADRASDRAPAAADLVAARGLRRLPRLLLVRQADLQSPAVALPARGRHRCADRDDLHRAAGILLHPGEARSVRRHLHRLPGDRLADLHVRRARALSQRAQGLPAVPHRHADPVPDRRRARLFRGHAARHEVLPVDAADRRQRRCRSS